VLLEFGVHEDGSLWYVDVRRSSGYSIYDDEAVKAVKLGAPFPAVPAELMAQAPGWGYGIQVGAHFNYVAQPIK
jgi:TonB family protein